MLKAALTNGIGSDKRIVAVNVVLIVNAFVWYFYSFIFQENIVNNSSFTDSAASIFGAACVAIAVSAILSASFNGEMKSRTRFLSYWMLAGVAVSLLPLVINLSTYPSLILFSTISGAYFGWGMPICLGYFASSTKTENRARLSGLTFLLIGTSFVVLGSLNINDVTSNALVLAAWRGIGLAAFIGLRPPEVRTFERTKEAFQSILSNRSFLLYFIPWGMFMLINLMVTPIAQKLFPNLPSDVLSISSEINSIIAFSTAALVGFLADMFGRKRLTIGGFAIIGIAYAILGLAPGNVTGWWFYTITDGVAWGIFYAVFLITIWGDLSKERPSEKYYAIGSLPFLISVFMRVSIGNYVADNIPLLGFFSYASFFLFIAILPLVYAPETLPEKVTKDRDLKSYVENAKKKAQKEFSKINKKEKTQDQISGEKPEPKDTEEYKEAAKLAEKYY